MNIELINNAVNNKRGAVTVLFFTQERLKTDKNRKLYKKAGFTATQDSNCFLYEKNILACGLENRENDNIRSAVGSAIKALKLSNFKVANFSVENKNIKAIVEGLVLGGYEFNQYKTKPKKVRKVRKVQILD